MNRPEQSLHIALVAHLRHRLPKSWLVHHSPNGGYRTKVEAARFQQMGTLAGFPDLLLIGPELRRPGGGLTAPGVVAIEVKAPPKRLKSGELSKAAPDVSPAQRDVIAALGECCIPTVIVRSVDEAEAALKAMGVPIRGKVL